MAGFLGFFNYEKEGKGVRKDEPQKKGFARFFELFFRKFWKYMQISMMYFITCIPAILFYYFLAMLLFQEVIEKAPETSVIATWYVNLLLIFFSASPFKAGFTYILRKFVREDHAWEFSDFFVHTKNNFKQAISVFLIDLAVLTLFTINLRFYMLMSGRGLIYTFALGINLFILCIYIAMQPYMWSMMVTFRLTLKQLYKNAFIFSVLGIKRNVIAIVVNAAVYLLLANFLQPMFIAFLYFLVLLAASGLVTQMNIQPVIKKYMLDKLETESEDEEETTIYGDEPEEDVDDDIDDGDIQEVIGENDVASLFNKRKDGDDGYDD